MIQKQKIEIAVGVFVAIGIAALVMLAMKVSNMSTISGGESYKLTARFDNIGGLKVRSPVMMAGVRIGQVSGVTVDKKTFEAVVTVDVSQDFDNLPTDSSASIFTAGLLGEQYLAIEPGGEMNVLKDGDEVQLTQSALVLEQVVGQVLFKAASGE